MIVGVAMRKIASLEKWIPWSRKSVPVPDNPAKPVPLLTYPTRCPGNPLRNPKKVASPSPQLIPTKTQAVTATPKYP